MHADVWIALAVSVLSLCHFEATPFSKAFEQRVLHRSAYVGVMLEEATAAGAVLLVGANVVDINFDIPQVVLDDGRIIKADVIVGADGRRGPPVSFLFIKPSLPT